MKTVFDDNATKDKRVEKSVLEFLEKVSTLESKHVMPIIIFQDGANGSYYIKCSILASVSATLYDLDAKLEFGKPESFRANRELLLKHMTYQKMEADATKGREFNDIIVEYNTEYKPDTPLKVWGGQHRTKAIASSVGKSDRFHGFRIYFNLTKDQRTDLALVSNTNISVSNDTFDRMIEETKFGDALRGWCQKVGLLGLDENFPDTRSGSEKITVKQARSFIVNFYLGKELGAQLKPEELDKRVYEPYLTVTGTLFDSKYEEIMKSHNIATDEALKKAGQKFVLLHNAQYKTVRDKTTKIKNTKAYRNKALVESVLCGWSYVAGLLQNNPARLENHYRIPKTTSKIQDPLNAEEMSQFKHDSDPSTYRGLGTRSLPKDRQRVAQLFLAKSRDEHVVIDKIFINKAVSQVVGIIALSKGYA